MPTNLLHKNQPLQATDDNGIVIDGDSDDGDDDDSDDDDDNDDGGFVLPAPSSLSFSR